MQVIIYALISVILDSLLSLLGASFLLLKRKVFDQVVTYTLAFSSGILLGATFLDILPEGLSRLGNTALLYTLAGIITFFALEKLITWHHHADEDLNEKLHQEKPLAYLTLTGDGIHNFIDGVIIGVAYLISIPIGLTTTIAVIAHEIPHELSDFTLLIYSGFSNRKALLWNFLSGLTSVAGTVIVLMISTKVISVSGYLLSFTAGNFLYIAASDLIPELHKKTQINVSVLQLILIIVGAAAVPFVQQFFK